MRQQIFRAGLTALTLAAFASLPTLGEEARSTEPRIAAAAVAQAKLLRQIGQFNTGCSGTAWGTGETGVCAFIACDNGCSALSCTYDSGYEDGYVELDCLSPSGGGTF